MNSKFRFTSGKFHNFALIDMNELMSQDLITSDLPIEWSDRSALGMLSKRTKRSLPCLLKLGSSSRDECIRFKL